MNTAEFTVTPYSFDFEQVFNDEEFRDAGGGLFTSGRTGNRWRFTVTFKNVHGERRRALWAQIAAARGKQNRIRLPMSLLKYSREGNGGGTPLLNGAHSAGATFLLFDGGGGVGAASDYLVRGDWISIGNELKIVTADVDTSSGAGTIFIWPELHQDRADGASIEITSPHGDFFVVDAQGLGAVPGRKRWINPTVTLVLEEDVRA